MLKKLVFTFIAVLIAASSFAALSHSATQSINQDSHNPILKSKLPKEYIEVIANADEMLFIDIRNNSENPAVKVSEGDIDSTIAILLSDDSYLFGATKLTLFIPSTKVTFKKGTQQSTLSISDHAKKVQFLDHNGDKIETIDIRDQQFVNLQNIINKYFN